MWQLLVLIATIIGVGYFVMYNRKVLHLIATSQKSTENLYYRLLGKRVKAWNTSIERTASIKKDSIVYKINMYFKEIIVNLDMSRSHVTPIGLIVFLGSIALSVSILVVYLLQDIVMFVPIFLVVAYFLIILVRFLSLLRYEKKEAEIMDAEDLIAMDVKDGVANAIVRYRHSFHPSVQPYFEEFIDNMQNKGYGFKEAMLILNDQLGVTFTDFAQKAILYEEKADATMGDIFTSVVEVNRFRRMLRYEANKKFDKLRLSFILSVGVIAAYCLFSVFTDPFLSSFFQKTTTGKILLMIDVVIITAVLGYISSIKAKFL